ncbi:hypothetical protein [Ciceribacter selenitireducens]
MILTEVAEGSTVKRVASRISSVALAGPGAITLLGQASDKLDLSSILSRIVLHFRQVTTEFWLLLSSAFNIKLPIDPEILTIFALVILPTFFQRRSFSATGEGQIYISISLCLTYLICVFLIPPPIDGKFMLFSTYFLFATYLVNPQIRLAFFNFSGMWFVIKAVFWFCLCLTLISILNSPQIHLPFEDAGHFFSTMSWIALFLMVIAVALRRILTGAPGPFYIVLMGVGIYVIDWFAKTAKPAIETWLSSVGA